MTTGTDTLICRNVWKVFGARAAEHLKAVDQDADRLAALGLVPAVRAVDLTVRRGEIFVIMGLSGSGKSTLVRCLSRLIEPTAGEILFNGQNLLTASDTEMTQIRRHKMGMVFQHFALLPHMTVLDNVAFPLEVQGMARPARESRAAEMISLVGLSGREAAFPRQLSGGQQQRVGIARSLAAEPELWFLDEPFSALDPLIRRELQGEFMRLQSRLHKTIVFITHDFDEAIRLADRIAIMKDGAVVQCGTPEDLVLNPATDYVREFTRAVPRAKVVRLASLVMPGPVPGGMPTLSARATVADAGPSFLSGAAQVGVVEDGQPIGTVQREDVIRLLLGGDA
ncbi:MAG: betaine/proline/choline family ABC transporter ATP-binding protein [Pseudotabrizicola sp.]|uniref:quaternary amine ABC transporter ATP-binding protein n=1 Tax=Pseudotabrizicola sp. TaxID=2939647 RepID=UPI00271F005A|nr:betaine/proline/choline family ABC transporter ATP-binding protein [Pseudotabrizicola sp.]MDO8884547.1 betaine/proline/choline family ABC transporter ATP-binding protein [Pseudotabrizicola sp.]MDP2081272.1 betaine/proline/choline family ABC transporter ATP-binding protein [Pseudotabrizicola sp.]MDZ7576109.1 betaine/proline/choline family ABC transporter ATP-binding protein [Pseudotabrizicola sp.]